MLGGSSGGVPIVPMQLPFTQVPLQGRLQPPQLVLLVFVSMQAFPHSICPDAEQPHVPPLQTEPAGHWVPQPPQLRAFIVVSTHAPSEHSVSLPSQLALQAPPLQTWPDAHWVPQPPQLFTSAGMQAPPQASRPAVH
jgi:hypothetical protein